MRPRHRPPAAAVLAGILAGGILALAGPASAAPPGSRCSPPHTGNSLSVSWAQRRLAPERAWLLSRGGGVTVAVVDSGVGRSVPALAGRVLPGADVATGTGAGDSDCSGHGTFVAGLVAAAPVRGSGFAGIAPDAVILPIRVTAPGQFQGVPPDLLAAGIEHAVRGGASVIAVAPAAAGSSPALERAVRLARRSDRLIVAAAVTTGIGQDAAGYPGQLPGVLPVAAFGPDGQAQALPAGARPALAAPGDQLVGPAASGGGTFTASEADLAVGYVAGAAALVRAYRPQLTAPQVAARLTATADPGPLGAGLGAGVVDPLAAVTAVLPPSAERPAATAAAPVEVRAASDPAPPAPRPVLIAVAVALIAALGAVLAADTIVRARRAAGSGRQRTEVP